MNDRKCPNCGASLQGGTYYCAYCGTDWTPVEPITPDAGSTIASPLLAHGEPRAGSAIGRTILFIVLLLFCPPAAIIYLWLGLRWPRSAKITVTIILLLPIVLFLVFGLLNEAIYNEHLDTPKYTENQPPRGVRPTLDAEPVEIYKTLRKATGLSISERKKRFLSEYAGKWITWRGKIDEIYIYDSIASNLKLQPEETKTYDIKSYFDPLRNDQLEALQEGDIVTVNGMIWGYYFMSNTIRLADSSILRVEKAKRVVAPKQK